MGEESARTGGFGHERILRASVLDRYPSIDRSTVAFPSDLVEFFFEYKETVLLNYKASEDGY